MRWYDEVMLVMMILAAVFLIKVNAQTITVQMAFDFRDNKWKTIEFRADPDKVLIYTTIEDVTNRFYGEMVDGKIVFYIEKDGYDRRK